jgi:antiphage defense system Thoeris ThsB-like protein
MSDTHNVFLSHRHEDDALVGDFKELMKDQNVDIRDSSITNAAPNQAKDPDYIKREILAPRIRWAGKLVVLVTPDTKNHDWVDWEVDYANKQGEDKRIIGVWAAGAEDADLPDALKRHADAVVPWDASKIVNALDGQDNWEHPDGTVRGLQPTRRIGC